MPARKNNSIREKNDMDHKRRYRIENFLYNNISVVVVAFVFVIIFYFNLHSIVSVLFSVFFAIFSPSISLS